MYLDFFETDDGTPGAATPPQADLWRCGVCFDVKHDDGELEEGDEGIGACYYYDADVNL